VIGHTTFCIVVAFQQPDRLAARLAGAGAATRCVRNVPVS
jgi:hypothetical protein